MSASPCKFAQSYQFVSFISFIYLTTFHIICYVEITKLNFLPCTPTIYIFFFFNPDEICTIVSVRTCEMIADNYLSSWCCHGNLIGFQAGERSGGWQAEIDTHGDQVMERFLTVTERLLTCTSQTTVCAKTPSNQIIQSHLPTFIGWWKLPLLHWNVFSWEKYEKVVNGCHALKDFGKYFFSILKTL